MRIRLYHTYVDDCPAALARLWDTLPATRQRQLAARTPAARAEGAVLCALLQAALTAWETEHDGAVEEAALTVSYPAWETNADGKPFADGILTATGRVYPAFSHSHGHVMVVLCDHPCGADLQRWDVPAFAPARWQRTATRICHPDNAPAASAHETARQFAAKEAALKCAGCGLRRPLSSVKLGENPLAADGQPLVFYETVPFCVGAVVVSR